MDGLNRNSPPFPAQYEAKTKPSAKYTLCDCFVTVLSLLIYIADVITDIILGVKYLKSGYFEWGALTLMLCILPSAFVQAISLRWHIVDQTIISLPIMLSHVSLLGVVQRYCTILKFGVESQQINGSQHQNFQLLCHYQSDVCLLRLFESFLESAPQLLLQLYIMHELGSWDSWTGLCAIGSLLSLAWGVASYARTMRNSREDKARITWIGLALQAVWRTGTMISRIMALLVCASVIHLWFLLVIVIHWLGMTVWTIKQKTDLCTTAWEERIYNCVVGVIYCFCFFNIKEGKSRRKAIIFYTVTAVENAVCLAIFMKFSHEHTDHIWFYTTVPVLIVVGSFLGHISQLVYYRWFHPSGPIDIQRQETFHVQETTIPERIIPEQSVPDFSTVFAVRTLKNMNRKFSGVSLASAVNEHVVVASVKIEAPEKSVENNNPFQGTLPCSETVEVMKLQEICKSAESPRQRTVKSWSDSKLDISVPNHFKSCEIQMIKTKSEGHLQANSFSSGPVKPLRVSLLNSEVALAENETSINSVHDYENMAVLNINRSEWGIRHWKSYSDIENSFHDNSVYKEREPLESSVTSASSTDSGHLIPSGKLSIEEAIAQLKLLAVHGHNEYQPDSSASKLYEFIWLNQNENDGVVVAPVRQCPTTGHNLSIITEVSESNSTSSAISKSSLVQTVDAIMNNSVNESTEDSHLTYVEVSFLSKLSESSVELNNTIESSQTPGNSRPARRQFSIIRDKFEDQSNDGVKHQTNAHTINKENTPTTLNSPASKTQDLGSPFSRQPLKSLHKVQSTLSPESRIFSQSPFNC